MKTLFKIIVAPFKIVATFITIVLMLVTAVLLILAGMFAYRASQPLDRPEFGGLSYFEYLEYREWAQQQNRILVSEKKKHPEYADASCYSYNLYDDLMVMGLGAYFAKGHPTVTWRLFEDGLYQVDFEKGGLRLGRDGGCDMPLSPALETWKKTREQAVK
jgi:hypothetical protein